MENQAEFFYEELKNSTAPGNTLVRLLSDITNRSVGRPEIIMINKLVKLFGKYTVFFSILDLSRYENLEGNLYPLLYAICRNRFETSHGESSVVAFESLNKRIAALEKQIEKIAKKKIKVPSPEELE